MRFSALTLRSLPTLVEDNDSSLGSTCPALTHPKANRQPQPQPHHPRPSRTASPSVPCVADSLQPPWTTVSKRHKKPNPASQRFVRELTTSGLGRGGGIPSSTSPTSGSGDSTEQGANNNNNTNNEHNNSGSNDDATDRGGNNNDENSNNKRPRFENDPVIRDPDSHLPSVAQYFYLRGADSIPLGDAMYKFFERTYEGKGLHTFRFFPTNKMTQPPPPDITKLADYPVDRTKHEQYFLRKRLSRPIDNTNGYRYTVCMYSTMSTVALKKKVLPVLRQYDLWMDSTDIWKLQGKQVAVILQNHTRLTHRDSLRDDVNAKLTSMITNPTPPSPGTALPKDGTGDVEFTTITSDSDPDAVTIENINLSRVEKQLLLDTLDENSGYRLSIIPRVQRLHHQGKVTLSEVLSVEVCNP